MVGNFQGIEGNGMDVQRMAENNLQMSIAESYQKGMIEVEKAKEKANISIWRETEIYKQKLLVKTAIKEQEQARIEEVVVDDSGKVTLNVRNTIVNTKPRYITNLQRPELTIFKLLHSEMPPCFMLSGLVNGEEVKVFLDSERIGYGSYAIRKLAAGGIFLYLPEKKMKQIFIQLVTKLVQNCTEKKSLPEHGGWTKMEDGEFRFFGEEDLNWGRIKELCK